MTNLIQWFDFLPTKRGGKNNQQGERQLMISHSRKEDKKSGYWRVVIGKQVAEEILAFAGDQFNVRFGKNIYTGELFMAVFKGVPVVNYSPKEYERSARLCFTCKDMYEKFCEMVGISKNTPQRIYYELSENLAVKNDVLTYKINLPF